MDGHEQRKSVHELVFGQRLMEELGGEGTFCGLAVEEVALHLGQRFLRFDEGLAHFSIAACAKIIFEIIFIFLVNFLDF
jgi:hypothetical protein